MKIQILTLAERDLALGVSFYEDQCAGLGDYFLDSLSSDIDSLMLYAGVHRKTFGYYRLLSRVFPFAVYYKLEGNLVRVFRVLDCRQDPRKLKEALE
ncbi:MAG: type II toxin-antitoxin system RelE/ParE family toxin [Puniceicoccales bacterium]